MKVVVVGCGLLGSRLAANLGAAGHEVAVVDRRPEAFAALGDSFGGETAVGTGIDVDVLRRAGVEEADAVVAVTDCDNTNLMAAQVARQIFKVRRVVARVMDPERAEIYRPGGFDIICPTTRTVDIFQHAVLGGE